MDEPSRFRIPRITNKRQTYFIAKSLSPFLGGADKILLTGGIAPQEFP